MDLVSSVLLVGREVGVSEGVLDVDGWPIPGRAVGFLDWGDGARFGRGAETFAEAVFVHMMTWGIFRWCGFGDGVRDGRVFGSR